MYITRVRIRVAVADTTTLMLLMLMKMKKLAAQESVRQFRFYLERISQNNTIQIFIDSMNGSFDNIQIKDITPAYFAGDNFELEETQLLTVYSE